MAKALVKQEKFDEAIIAYQMGLELQPRNLELAMGLSEILLAKNPELSFQDIMGKLILNVTQEIKTENYLLELPCSESPTVPMFIHSYTYSKLFLSITKLITLIDAYNQSKRMFAQI